MDATTVISEDIGSILEDINKFINFNIEIEVSKKGLKLSNRIKDALIEPEYNINIEIADRIKNTIYNSFRIEYARALSKVLEQINEKYNMLFTKKHYELEDTKFMLNLFKEKTNKYKIQNDYLMKKNYEFSEELSIIRERILEIDENERKFKEQINKLQSEKDKLINKNNKLENKMRLYDNIQKHWDKKCIMYFKDSICKECLTVRIKSIEYLNIETLN
jgi:hypothetical protein